MVNKNDKFWYNDLNILFKKDRLNEFFPNESMSENEKLNSIVRACFYTAIVLFIYNKNTNYMYIGIIGLIGTYIIHKYVQPEIQLNHKIKEVFNKSKPYIEPTEIIPTKDNPFMNIMLDDYEKPNRKIKKNIAENKEIKKDIKNNFEYNLYKDISDVYEKNNSQRQYYTTPITTIPNKQKNFAQWLYGVPNTCKEGNTSQCTGNIYSPLNSGSRLPLV